MLSPRFFRRLPALAIAFALTTPASAQVSLLELINRLDAVVAQGQATEPSSSATRLSSIMLNALLADTAAADRGGVPEAARPDLVASYVTVRLRQVLGERPYQTERPGLADKVACRGDLALDRFPARLAAAWATGAEHERLLTLLDYQNALNCLSARQLADYADRLGAVLGWSQALYKAQYTEMTALFNMALMTFDMAKYVGTSRLYLWLRQVAPIAHDRHLALDRPIYLYDYMSGHIVGLRGDMARTLKFGAILDPSALGSGACSILEMAAKGAKTGNFGCGRNLGCEQNAETDDSGGTLWDRRLPHGTDFDLNRTGTGIPLARDSGGNYTFQRRYILPPIKTPFGVDREDAREASCGGVGLGAGDAGLAGFAQHGDSGSGALADIGQGSWQGCIAAATIASSLADGWANCAMNTAPRPGETFWSEAMKLGKGLRTWGLPGSDRCSNPMAQDGGEGRTGTSTSYNPFDGDDTDDKAALREGADLAANKLESKEGLAALLELGHHALDSYQDWVKGSNLSAEKKTQRLNKIEDVRADMVKKIDTLAITTASKVRHSDAKALNGLLGLTETHSSGLYLDGLLLHSISVYIRLASHNTANGIAGTLFHEGGHVFVALLARLMGTKELYYEMHNAVDVHPFMEAQRIFSAIAPWLDSALEEGNNWSSQEYEDLYEEELDKCLANTTCIDEVNMAYEDGTLVDRAKEAEEKANGGSGTDQMPADPAQCSPLQAALGALLSCTGPGGGVSGGGGAGGAEMVARQMPGGTAMVHETTTLPTLDQWTAGLGGVFTQCLEAFGVGAPGVDDRGRIIAGVLDPSNATGCGAMLCTGGTSAAAVGGGCACATENGDIGRYFSPDHLCFTSDLCLPSSLGAFAVTEDAGSGVIHLIRPITLQREPGRLPGVGLEFNGGGLLIDPQR